MKQTRTRLSRHLSLCLLLLAFVLPLLACAGSNNIQGKWEGTIVSKRSGQSGKVIFEFLPDGTFNAMPAGDTILVDQNKYQVLDEGRTIKIRSQLLGGAANEVTCKFVGSALQCDTEEAQTTFRRL